VKTDPAPQAPAPVCTVDLRGDSILFGGYNLTQRIAEPPAVALARIRPAFVVTDHSKSGDTATAAMPAFINEPMTGIRVVVIGHGLNDAITNIGAYEPAMRAMIERAKALKVAVVVTGLIQIHGGVESRDAADAIARRLASEYGVLFADWGSIPIGADDTHDGVHVKQAKSLELVERLALSLDAAMPECAGGH
jgi:hypothetical protein